MRTGLLAVGAAMAIVGAGVVVAVAMPFGPGTPSKTDRVWQSSVSADSWEKHELPAVPAGTAAIMFSWNTSRTAQVYWYAAGPCVSTAGWCLDGGPLAFWSDNTTGHWTDSGPPPSGYCIMVDDPSSAPVNFSGELVESYAGPSHRLPMVPLLLILGGGSLLAGIGGLAIYLGLFLPSGVYSAPEATPRPDGGDDDAPPEPPG